MTTTNGTTLEAWKKGFVDSLDTDVQELFDALDAGDSDRIRRAALSVNNLAWMIAKHIGGMTGGNPR